MQDAEHTDWLDGDHLLQGFAGTLFVRSEEEVQYLQQHSILQLLTDVGFPWR